MSPPPALSPRGARRYRHKAKLRQVGTAPRTAYGEGSPREVISGLHHTASALAVYASLCGFRRTTQDSLLAAGQALPDGIGYPQGSYERFPRCLLTSLPPFPSFLAQTLSSTYANRTTRIAAKSI